MNTTSRTSFLWVLALVGVVATPSWAIQQPAEPDPVPEAVAPAQEEVPLAIPLAEIPRRIEESRLRLGQIETTVSEGPAVETISAELGEWTELLTEEREAVARLDLTTLSLRDLNEARNRWLTLGARGDEWLRELEARSTTLESVIEEVRALAGAWTLTQQEASDDAPQSVRDAIENVLTELDRIEASVQERLSAVLTLESTIADQGVLVREQMEQVDGALAEARDSMLAADADPIWSFARTPGGGPGFGRESLDHLGSTWVSTSKYFRDNADRVAAHGLAFVALLWLFTELAKRRERWTERDHLASATKILSHPVANALLITLLLSRVWYPRAPLGFLELNRFLLLGPLLVVLPGLVNAALRRPLYGLAALYCGDLVVGLLPSGSLATRWVQLVLTVIAFSAFLRFSRPGSRAAELDLGSWWRAALLAARAGAALLGVAVAANVLGRTRLSTLVTEGVLASAYTAVLLCAGYLVLQGLVTLLLETEAVRSFGSIRAKSDVVRGGAVKLLRLVAVGFWLVLTLKALQLLTPFVDATSAVLRASFSIGELEISVDGVLSLLLVVYLSVMTSRMARTILEEDVLPPLALPRGLPNTISKLAGYAILFVGFVAALVAAGVQLDRLALLAGAFGLGIGFGLQNIVNNFVSGVILLFERPIQSGDTIELESVFGKVRRIGIRSSTVRTFDGADVIVPNSQLIDGKLINWTFSDYLRRMEIHVGVAYGSRPQVVLDTLVEAARAHDEVLDHPEPYAIFDGFGDSSLDFTLRAWTAKFDDFVRIQSELGVAVHDVLESAGFEIPFPQRDLHIRSNGDATAIDSSAAKEKTELPRPVGGAAG